MRTYIHTHTYVQIYMCVCIYTHTHTHTHTHTWLHSHTHKETEVSFHSGRQASALNAGHKRKSTASLKRQGLSRGDGDIFYQVSEIFLSWQRMK